MYLLTGCTAGDHSATYSIPRLRLCSSLQRPSSGKSTGNRSVGSYVRRFVANTPGEIIDSYPFHSQLAPAIYPRALSIIQGRAVGVAHTLRLAY